MLEISTSCAPARAAAVAARTGRLLTEVGIEWTGPTGTNQTPQQTKTRASLEFFTRALGHAAVGDLRSGTW